MEEFVYEAKVQLVYWGEKYGEQKEGDMQNILWAITKHFEGELTVLGKVKMFTQEGEY